MPRMAHHGWILPGDNLVVDRAGWQCQDSDPGEPGGRCRLVPTHTHRRYDRARDQLVTVAVCAKHYEAAGPEATSRQVPAIRRSR